MYYLMKFFYWLTEDDTDELEQMYDLYFDEEDSCE